MANTFDNALGWESFDAQTGQRIGGGSFDVFPNTLAAGRSPGLVPGGSMSSTNRPLVANSDFTDFSGIPGVANANPTGTNASGGNGAGGGGGFIDNITGYLIRGTIVVLGLVFVAVGLSMFKPGVVVNPVEKLAGKPK